MIDKAIFEYGLSPKSVGVLAYLLSKPDDWIIHQCEVMNHFGIGKVATKSAFDELIKKGFMSKSQLRNTDGQYRGVQYILYEVPSIQFQKEYISYEDYLKTDHWKRRRKKALSKGDYKCSLCASRKRLQVHHNTYSNLWGEKDSDLTILCQECHTKFHNKAEVCK